jgi:hypothetical protein
MGENNTYNLHIFDQMVKGRKYISKTKFKTTRTKLSAKTKSLFAKKQGSVKAAVGSILSLVSGTYHEIPEVLSWKWRHFASKSAMFLATLC